MSEKGNLICQRKSEIMLLYANNMDDIQGSSGKKDEALQSNLRDWVLFSRTDFLPVNFYK